MRYILSLCLAIAVPWPAQAELFHLAPPEPPPPIMVFDNLPFQRTIAFDALSTFSIDLAGIVFDPFLNGTNGVKVSIRQVALTGGVGTRGPILASNTAVITDLGLSLYSVPIDFAFIAGNRYDVAFEGFETFGSGTVNSWQNDRMAVYQYGFPDDPPYTTTNGLVSVISGGLFFGESQVVGYGPFTPLVIIRSISAEPAVPEPSTIVLAVMAAGLLGLYRLRMRK